jgi:hypothetical protein
MRKRFCDFGDIRVSSWPAPEQLKHYFFGPPGQEWLQDEQNDSAVLSAQGVERTEHLKLGEGRVNLHLMLWGNPELGVMLMYSKTGGGVADMFCSKGDLRRLREWVRTTHNDLRPVGLFIPFENAYFAVKEFIETDGELPKCIEWVANKDLPPGTFPDP